MAFKKVKIIILLCALVGVGLVVFKLKNVNPDEDQSSNTPSAKSQERSPASAASDPEAKPPHHVHHFSSTAPSGYAPAQIRRAYQVDLTTSNGAGQKIAIIDAFGSPTIQSDLNTFNAQFGLPAANFRVYYPQGKIRRGDSGWALETSLDVEWAHAIAPAATLILVVAKSAYFSDLLSAVDYAVGLGATQISMSWGASEFQGETSYDFHFNNSKATYFASSGDSGSGVIWPAASPNVVSVGGTTLYLDSAGNITQPEIAWSGSGGGLSAYEAAPSFQSQAQPNNRRGVPDVSFDADPATGFPVYDSAGYNGQSGWFQVGGTSAGAPQWAALSAIAQAQRTSRLSSFDTAIYSLATPTNQSTYFQDITSGCNAAPSPMTCAQPGYDFVTGLGSPHAQSLVNGLVSF